MPRSIWNGAITFGLITIPVKLFGAVEEKDVGFHQLHGEDNGRIRYKRVCQECGNEVTYDDIVKGYEFEKDSYVVFSPEELERIPADSVRAIDVVAFVDLDEIDPVYFQRPYYLAPETTGVKAYRLLEEAMNKSGKVGVAKITLRDKERLATLRVKDGVLVLETMHWPDEIRRPEFEELEKKAEIRENERDMAMQLIDNLTDSFRPEEFSDDYRTRLEKAIEDKIEGKEIAAATPERQPPGLEDLMDALKASLDATGKKGEGGGGGEEPAEKTAKRSKSKSKAKV